MCMQMLQPEGALYRCCRVCAATVGAALVVEACVSFTEDEQCASPQVPGLGLPAMQLQWLLERFRCFGRHTLRQPLTRGALCFVHERWYEILKLASPLHAGSSCSL
jgi:hypothetical protein